MRKRICRKVKFHSGGDTFSTVFIVLKTCTTIELREIYKLNSDIAPAGFRIKYLFGLLFDCDD
jgi:hypothetical protein